MINQPLITVIVPVHNCAYYLKKCISSILNQTYRHLKIILIDDGSTDKSGVLCDKYAAKDSRVRVLHKPNGGVSSVRNKGLEEASGEYVTFVDADDWLPVDAIEALYEAIAAADADISMGTICLVGASPHKNAHIWGGENYYIDKREEMTALIEGINSQPAPFAKLIKTDLIKKNHLTFPLGIAQAEDMIFFWKLLDKCRIAATTHKTVYYYSKLAENNACSQYYPDANKWCFLEIRALADFIRYETQSDKEMRVCFLQYAFSKFLLSCQRYARVPDKKEAIKKIKETIKLYDDYLKDIEAFTQNEADGVLPFTHCDIALKRDAGAIYDDLSANVNSFRRKAKAGFRSLMANIKRPFIYRF